MRCQYCFYSDVSKRRSIRDKGVMSEETLEILVKRVFLEPIDFCTFLFQGGEPTLAGLNFYRSFIQYVQKYNIRNVGVSFSIQTNGLAIDKEWACFLSEHQFLVGLSIDGSKDIHNFLRVDSSGKGTYAKVMRAVTLLSKEKVNFNVLTVVTKYIAKHPNQVYQFYKKNNFRYIQFIPCIDDFDNDGNDPKYALTARDYGEFLCHIFDLWYRDFRDDQYYSIRGIDNYIHLLMGRGSENCAMCGKCTVNPVVEADGSVYPCDFYVLDEYQLGNVRTDSFADLITSKVAKEFLLPSAQPNEQCSLCEYHFICRNGCHRDRTGDNLNKYCESYKMFFSYTMSRMKEIARLQR